MYSTNFVPAIDLSKSTTGCCTLIDPKEWDEQMFTFDNKLFAKARTRSFLHIPLNMGSVMKKTQSKIDEIDAAADDWLILSHETSPWHADHYFAVKKDVPNLEMEKMSGKFMTKVFEGEYKEAQSWYKQLITYIKAAGKRPIDTYFFYTTCPNCAKKYGKNYVVGFGKISES
jgi:hypothetical protein